MDQLKIGKFIAQMRKEKGLTQRALADKLLISDKTVSKWECGNGLPEVSLMMPLCEILGITVNELLSGKRLAASEYQQNAEENIMKLIEEKNEVKFRLILEAIVIFLTLVSFVTIILISQNAQLEDWTRILLIIIAVVIMFGGIGVAGALEMRCAIFECPKCHKRFEPTKTAFLMAVVHTVTRRRLRCPHCGIKSWCKRCLTSDEEE